MGFFLTLSFFNAKIEKKKIYTFLACLAARIYHKTCKDSFTNTPKTRFSVRISLWFDIIVIILANIMMLYTHKCQS